MKIEKKLKDAREQEVYPLILKSLRVCFATFVCGSLVVVDLLLIELAHFFLQSSKEALGSDIWFI